MLPRAEQASPQGDSTTPTNDTNITPPAFLDLADSAARLNSNLPDINARIEQKRLEHERQRLLQRQHFEEQMRALELQQQQEERALLTPASENPPGSQHVALSAPTTPPRGAAAALVNGGDPSLPNGGSSGVSFLHHQALTNGIPEEFKRHSGNYGSLVSPVVESGSNLAPGSHHTAGAKSMPGSRRGSSGSMDAPQDMLSSLNFGSLSIQDKPVHPRLNGHHPLRSTTNPEYLKAHAASMFDEEIDNEMSSSFPRKRRTNASMSVRTILVNSPFLGQLWTLHPCNRLESSPVKSQRDRKLRSGLNLLVSLGLLSLILIVPEL
ncbi:hypothetical protein DL93DRAFT_1909766 [Clavulina sp. PMI_390]|nr:hypothetical protein DL93DRAFT_1909766 [Clavulina sp. PMI_390]